MKKLLVFCLLLSATFIFGSTVSADFVYEYEISSTLANLDGSVAAFHGTLFNTSNMNETYHIRLFYDQLPEGWFANFCGESWCVPDSITIDDMPPGDSLNLVVDIYNSVTDPSPGTGVVTFQIQSEREPNLMENYDFSATFGAEVMIVDDDGDDDYELQYSQFFDDLDLVYYLTDQANLMAQVDSIDLSQLPAIFWNVAWNFPVFVPEDVQLLTNYLDNGGNLFISGQDVGWDIMDEAGGSTFSEAQDFYQNYLDANYINSDR